MWSARMDKVFHNQCQKGVGSGEVQCMMVPLPAALQEEGPGIMGYAQNCLGVWKCENK